MRLLRRLGSIGTRKKKYDDNLRSIVTGLIESGKHLIPVTLQSPVLLRVNPNLQLNRRSNNTERASDRRATVLPANHQSRVPSKLRRRNTLPDHDDHGPIEEGSNSESVKCFGIRNMGVLRIATYSLTE